MERTSGGPDLVHGRVAAPGVLAATSTVTLVGSIRTAIGALGVLCGIGAWRRNRHAWIRGVPFAPGIGSRPRNPAGPPGPEPSA